MIFVRERENGFEYDYQGDLLNMNTVSRKKMYKSGKQWVALATVATVAGVAITANDKASADVWQANGVQQVTNQLAQAGGLANYNVQYGDTVWALALANGENLDTFVNQFGIVNPDVLFANESFMAQTTTGMTVQPQVVTEQTATSDAVVASQVADSVAASQAAASEAASEAASIAASQAAAASYAASVAQSQADAASMAAAESQATVASEAAAQQTASAALAAASSAAVAAQVAAEQASSQQQAAVSTAQAQVTAESQVQNEATVATVGSADMSTFDALNALRQSHGLAPLTFDNDLAARAQARAQQMANLGGVASDHYSTAGEVVAIDYAPGTSVVNAWFNETNMMPVGTTGHRDWEMNAGYSRVGIAIVGNVIVGEAN